MPTYRLRWSFRSPVLRRWFTSHLSVSLWELIITCTQVKVHIRDEHMNIQVCYSKDADDPGIADLFVPAHLRSGELSVLKKSKPQTRKMRHTNQHRVPEFDRTPQTEQQVHRCLDDLLLCFHCCCLMYTTLIQVTCYSTLNRT